ncbi:PREDICTED: dnaJ homolog subfamily A member 4-like [Condylura cristata]|uniref:dnaJ homolog subfamily A member 4-like n=1 Tax=Condylura cristata TaxID=143302 RepID=UPI0006432BA3|nr:PREDICTED: dnaJ homolog subfamily A member 4-like [Condylura cristata]
MAGAPPSRLPRAEASTVFPRRGRGCSRSPPGVGGKKGSEEKCPLCRGRGVQAHVQQIGPGVVQQIQTVCLECKGRGERISPKDRCEGCGGARVTREKKLIEVHVERGMKDGQKIVFHGEGDQEPELEPGDVIIVLDQKDHSVFQRRGHDLITKMRVQLSEALCGFKRTIKTLDDRTLVITSRPGEPRSSPPPRYRRTPVSCKGVRDVSYLCLQELGCRAEVRGECAGRGQTTPQRQRGAEQVGPLRPPAEGAAGRRGSARPWVTP